MKIKHSHSLNNIIFAFLNFDHIYIYIYISNMIGIEVLISLFHKGFYKT